MDYLETYPLLAPMFAQALFYFILSFMTVRARAGALGSGAVKEEDVALGQLNYPKKVQQLSNTLNNQYESPTYFFVAAILGMALAVQDMWMIAAAWVFIASRIVHAFVYLTTNRIRTRFMMYFVGFLAILVMWARLAVAVFGGG
ncbi:hypothetical protein DDZ18_06780 [Marinicauda salina]|uniref:MAPEG family protein n=1 Tax=Marinicauda salina TaxID=2135793 RepID=A0A2U2BTQ4_9PROT|nr:MAPEG family protein [Marinicauda salina]PWE17383.1 hypothetical protein DDZ18_06780 [Marinicauda salina]